MFHLETSPFGYLGRPNIQIQFRIFILSIISVRFRLELDWFDIGMI